MFCDKPSAGEVKVWLKGGVWRAVRLEKGVLDKVGALGRCGAGVVLGGGLGGQEGVAREVRGWRGRGVAGGVDVVAGPWREWLAGESGGGWRAWLEGWRVAGGIQLLKFRML